MDKINSLIPKINSLLINTDKIKSKDGKNFDEIFEIAFNEALSGIISEKNLLENITRVGISKVLIEQISNLITDKKERIIKRGTDCKKDDDSSDSEFDIEDGFLLVDQAYINAQVYAIIKEESENFKRREASKKYEKNFKYLREQNRGDNDDEEDGARDKSKLDILV